MPLSWILSAQRARRGGLPTDAMPAPASRASPATARADRPRVYTAPCAAPRSWPPSGPPRASRPCSSALVRAGVDVVRLNFSHGEPHEHLAVAQRRARDRAAADRPLAILQDLSGPKIRTGRVATQPIELRDGETVRDHHRRVGGGPARPDLHQLRPAAARREAGRPDPARRRHASSCASSRTAGEEVECVVVHGGLLTLAQGDEPAGREALRARPHREGPARPRLRRRRTAWTTSRSRSCARRADVEEAQAR